jgi:hypothetical protein
LRVVAPRPDGRHQGALGQAFEHHRIHTAAGQHHGRVDAVARKAGASTQNANRAFHHSPM